MEGRHVHPSTLYPGGRRHGPVGAVVHRVSWSVSRRYVEFMKKCVPLHDDLFDFFYEALPGYEKVGSAASCSDAGAPIRTRTIATISTRP